MTISRKLFFKLVRFYQLFISPSLGSKKCRFYPSCSQYYLEAVDKYGFFNGCIKGLKRIIKCHPFGRGGVDLP